MVAYLTKQGLLWDLTCEDGSRFKKEIYGDKNKALEIFTRFYPQYDIELLIDYKDQGYRMAKYAYELNTGMPYDGRCTN